jgi:PhnB protein
MIGKRTNPWQFKAARSMKKRTAFVQPYLFFNGCCEEALAFYRTAVGAEITMTMRYRESPEPAEPGRLPDGWGDKIMHAAFKIGDSLIMASDGCSTDPGFEGFALSISLPDKASAKRAFEALSKGGKVQMPLQKTFWSPCFGMLTDRYGLGWMVTIAE